MRRWSVDARWNGVVQGNDSGHDWTVSSIPWHFGHTPRLAVILLDLSLRAPAWLPGCLALPCLALPALPVFFFSDSPRPKFVARETRLGAQPKRVQQNGPRDGRSIDRVGRTGTLMTAAIDPFLPPSLTYSTRGIGNNILVQEKIMRSDNEIG